MWEQCHSNRGICTARRSLQKYHRGVLKVNGSPSPCTISCWSSPRSRMGNFCRHLTLPHGILRNICSAKAGGPASWLRVQQKREGDGKKEPRRAEIPRSEMVIWKHAYAIVMTTWKWVSWSTGVFSFKRHPTCNLDVAWAPWVSAFLCFFWLFLLLWTEMSFLLGGMQLHFHPPSTG